MESMDLDRANSHMRWEGRAGRVQGWLVAGLVVARAKKLGWIRAGELGTLVGDVEELLRELAAGSLEPVEGEVGVLPRVGGGGGIGTGGRGSGHGTAEPHWQWRRRRQREQSLWRWP